MGFVHSLAKQQIDFYLSFHRRQQSQLLSIFTGQTLFNADYRFLFEIHCNALRCLRTILPNLRDGGNIKDDAVLRLSLV